MKNIREDRDMDRMREVVHRRLVEQGLSEDKAWEAVMKMSDDEVQSVVVDMMFQAEMKVLCG